MLCNQFGLSASMSFVLSFCLSVWSITAKVISRFYYSVMIGPSNRKNLLAFGDDLVRIRISDYFSISLTFAE